MKPKTYTTEPTLGIAGRAILSLFMTIFIGEAKAEETMTVDGTRYRVIDLPTVENVTCQGSMKVNDANPFFVLGDAPYREGTRTVWRRSRWGIGSSIPSDVSGLFPPALGVSATFMDGFWNMLGIYAEDNPPWFSNFRLYYLPGSPLDPSGSIHFGSNSGHTSANQLTTTSLIVGHVDERYVQSPGAFIARKENNLPSNASYRAYFIDPSTQPGDELLPPLPQGQRVSIAYKITDDAEIVFDEYHLPRLHGGLITSVGGGTSPERGALMSHHGSYVAPLRTGQVSRLSDVSVVNGRVTAVGSYYGYAQAHPSTYRPIVMEQDGTVRELAVPSGRIGAQAKSITTLGQVFGQTWQPSGLPEAVMWDADGTPHNLHNARTASMSRIKTAFAIRNRIFIETLKQGCPTGVLYYAILEPEVSISVQGDLNCDGAVNNFDIDPFVLAISNAAAYEQQFPTCDRTRGDMNGDGVVNNFDINPFLSRLNQE